MGVPPYVMVSNNTQIPEYVDLLVQEESRSEWLFLPSYFHKFAFLNIELHTVQRTTSFQVLVEVIQGPHQNVWFLSFYNQPCIVQLCHQVVLN